MKIKVQQLPAAIQSLDYSTEGSAAVELRASVSDVCLQPGEIQAVATGLSLHIPAGFAGLVLPKSGQAKRGLGVSNSPGLIDEDFRGEIKILAHNMTDHPIWISKGERIAQLMFIPYVKAEFEVVESLDDSERGTGGFGSTGTV
jgi:dUTP pyrophosphatase